MSEKRSSREAYFKRLLENCGTEEQKRKYIEESYKVALDTRKFEIDMYWKRATYFWAFIAAIFVAYFTAINRETSQSITLLATSLSLMGFFFSVGWHMVARGSKVWQENWEMHIGYLEDEIHGPLFKTFKIPKTENAYYHFSSEYPFSVSKVNQVLSLYTCLFWLSLFTYSLYILFPQKIKDFITQSLAIDINTIHLIFYLAAIILFIVLLLYGFVKIIKYSKSFQVGDLKNSEGLKKEKGKNSFQSFYYVKRGSLESIINNHNSVTPSSDDKTDKHS